MFQRILRLSPFSVIFSIQYVPSRHSAWAGQWFCKICFFPQMISDMSNMRSIYVHSCIDDKGWFHIMLVRLNPIQPVSVIPGNDFVTSEVWCQLDLPGIFGCYSFHGTGWKLKSLSESCSFWREKKCELVAAKIKKTLNCKCEAVGRHLWKRKLKTNGSQSSLGKLHFSETVGCR